MAGKFIVFEGVDDDVLIDQARRMVTWLRVEGLTPVVTQQPTDGPIGAQVKLVLNGRLMVDELTEATLALADRMDHLYRKGDGILQNLADNKWVICSRYLLSAYAYQSQAVSLEWLRRINQPCPWPDLLIFIDTPVRSCLDRLVRPDGCDAGWVEARKSELTIKRRNYLRVIKQCQQYDEEAIVVDGSRPLDAIHRECRRLVERLKSGR